MRLGAAFFSMLFLWFNSGFCLSLEQEEKPECLVIKGARLIDGTGTPPLENAVIVIKKDKFAVVGRGGEIGIPKKASIIDLKGKTVIPGLIDSHVHFTYPPRSDEFFQIDDSISAFRAAHFLRRMLMVGVTTVRDVSSYQGVGIAARKAFQENLFLGSRPVVTGMGITSTGGHGTEGNTRGIAEEVDGPDGFRRAVRERLKAGADLIKVLSPYSREEIQAAVEETHAHEKFITVHSGVYKEQYDFVRWAVEAGADCIEHAYAIPDDVIERMALKGIHCVPTLSILVRLGNQYKEKGADWEWKVKRYFQSLEIFQKLKKAGVKMAIGTDAIGENMVVYPGFYFEEIERFVENGCTPLEAIVAATKIGATVSAAADNLGTIEKGKLADLLVLRGDPLNDIKALRSVDLIIQGGKIVKPSL